VPIRSVALNKVAGGKKTYVDTVTPAPDDVPPAQ
jgi:hypothetical protein